MVLGFSVVQAGGSAADGEFDVQRYWARAVSTAIAAKLLAGHAEVGSADEVFVAGLIQDIGVLALWRSMPREYTGVLEKYRSSQDLALHECERELLGIDHAAVSGWLIRQWQLPDSMFDAVTGHHSWDCGGPSCCASRSLRCVLELADSLSSLIWRDQSERQDSRLHICKLGLSSETLEGVIRDIQHLNPFESSFIEHLNCSLLTPHHP